MMLLRRQLLMQEDLLTDYLLKSRMMREYHVRFREGLGGKFPRSTRPILLYIWTFPLHKTRVLQPFPATIPSLQNTCFFAYPDSAVWSTFSYHDKPYPFTRTLPSGQLHQNMANTAHLPRLCHLSQFFHVTQTPSHLRP